MTGSVQKITLSASRDIPFNKLILSQANVRRIKAGVSVEELAEDIARRTLLQSLTVRAVVDADGNETGMYEIPAGGRRFRALEILVRQKRLCKTAPIPCVVREGGLPEEDSLAENIQRAPLHPLDQFRAFLTLREKGQSEEEIAAAFFVGVAVVRQRLRLASVSPKLLEAYAEDAMTLDQLMAFTVNGDHERQEQVFERLAQSYSPAPHAIRRMLTEGAVRACGRLSAPSGGATRRRRHGISGRPRAAGRCGPLRGGHPWGVRGDVPCRSRLALTAPLRAPVAASAGKVLPATLAPAAAAESRVLETRPRARAVADAILRQGEREMAAAGVASQSPARPRATGPAVARATGESWVGVQGLRHAPRRAARPSRTSASARRDDRR